MHYEKIWDTINKMQERHDALAEEQAKYDSMEQDILHYIEFEKYSASQGSRMLKKLKMIRIQRREAKNEFAELTSILKKINNSKLNRINPVYKQEGKLTYTPRVLSFREIVDNKIEI